MNRSRPSSPHPPLPDDHASLAGMGDDAVRKATGRSWSDWVAFLDAAGAADWEHAEIARRVAAEPGLTGWWSQSVTVGYERLRGLREPGQRRGGGFDVNKSVTLPVAVEALWDTVQDPEARAQWLPDLPLEESTATRPRSIRWKVADGTRLDAWFTEKGAEKSSVQFQHRGLPDQEAAARERGFWGERVEQLKARFS